MIGPEHHRIESLPEYRDYEGDRDQFRLVRYYVDGREVAVLTRPVDMAGRAARECKVGWRAIGVVRPSMADAVGLILRTAAQDAADMHDISDAAWRIIASEGRRELEESGTLGDE